MDRTKNYLFFTLVFLFVILVLNTFSFIEQVALCFPAVWITLFIVREINDSFKSTHLFPTLQDKAILITGCDTGFGHEFARHLDLLGVTVFAGCLFPEGKGALDLKKLCSKKLHVINLDVTKEELVKAAVKYVTASLGDKKLWSIVNNAGIGVYSEMELTSLEKIQEIMDVNVLGILRVTQSFLPFIRQAKGRVVIISSLAGRITMNGFTAYSMSKHAVVSIADGLRREMMKFNVSVHCIEPWFYRTNICEYLVQLKSLKDNWESSSEDVQRAYGNMFYKSCEKFVKDLQNDIIPPSRLHEVIDDMLDATLGRKPKIYYETGGGLKRKFYSSLPIKLLDYALYFQTPREVPLFDWMDSEVNLL